MSKAMPNMYFFMHGTHVHHLNYGIFLLATVGGYSIFRRPIGRTAEITALLYGVAMGLTLSLIHIYPRQDERQNETKQGPARQPVCRLPMNGGFSIYGW